MMSERERRFPAPRRGQLGFTLALLTVVALLLVNIGGQTVWAAKTPVFAQPRFWPAVGLGLMGLCGILYLRALPWKRFNRMDRREAIRWFKALEFVLWFMAYVLAVPRLGYLPVTAVFVPIMAWRMGYRTTRMRWISVGFGVATVLVFKTFLAVKIPGGAIYEYLPDALRSFFLINF
jgi:hypothetical protein